MVADVTEAGPGAFGEDVEVIALEPGTGWGAAANAGIRRATGRVVMLMDGSVEVAGDVIGPLESALSDDGVGIAGPFGIVTHDLREFEASPGPGPCDAIEGYCMAMRREVAAAVGGFDEKFRWYRTADIELSFRVKDRGLRTEVVPVPVVRHEHRMWFEPRPPTGPSGRSGTTTASWIGGVIGGTWCSTRTRRTAGRRDAGRSVDRRHRRRRWHRDLRLSSRSRSRLATAAAAAAVSPLLGLSLLAELLAVGDRLRAARVGLEILAVDRLDHQQQRATSDRAYRGARSAGARPGRAPR